MPEKRVPIELSQEEKMKQTAYLANLETIRLNQYIPFNLHEMKQAGLSTSSETLKTDPFDVDYIYIITSITAIEIGTATPQIKIGIKDGGTDFIYVSGTVANAEDSVEYVGQLLVKELDRIFATFESAVATDTIHLFINGYKIRR